MMSDLRLEDPPSGPLYASRVRVYPRKVKGRWRTVKWGLLAMFHGRSAAANVVDIQTVRMRTNGARPTEHLLTEQEPLVWRQATR